MELLAEQFQRELPRINPQDQNYVPHVVAAILSVARTARATDVHLLPGSEQLQMRWRIDGVLERIAEFPGALAPRIVARLKVLSQLLTYRTDIPQEGRLRVAAIPTILPFFLAPLLRGFTERYPEVDLHVREGTTAELVEQAMPLLRQLASEPRPMGEVGSAMATKLALNQLIASLTHSFSLSLHLVQRSGVAVPAFMELLRQSALYAPTFDKKLERELQRHYGDPNFPTAHLRKDLALFKGAAERAGLDSRGLEGLLTLLAGATAAGLDGLDYCALHELTAGRAAAAAPD